jgi:hypothetical protein
MIDSAAGETGFKQLARALRLLEKE